MYNYKFRLKSELWRHSGIYWSQRQEESMFGNAIKNNTSYNTLSHYCILFSELDALHVSNLDTLH